MDTIATVRVDARPSGKRFQGVWLEQESGERYVIAYRAHALWTAFANLRVVATGELYEASGQAIDAAHYRVHTLRPLDVREARDFLVVHPERRARGRVVVAEAPAGSKARLAALQQFREEGGTAWWIAGSDARLVVEELVSATLRDVELNPAYGATIGGDHVWIGATYPTGD